METKTVKIPNINCNHCVHTIESELSELNGVLSVEAALDTRKVKITWDKPTDWETIKTLLKEINYPAEDE